MPEKAGREGKMISHHHVHLSRSLFTWHNIHYLYEKAAVPNQKKGKQSKNVIQTIFSFRKGLIISKYYWVSCSKIKLPKLFYLLLSKQLLFTNKICCHLNNCRVRSVSTSICTNTYMKFWESQDEGQQVYSCKRKKV